VKKLALMVKLALCGVASPLAAQARTASIGVSATIAEPVRAPAFPSLRLDYREGKYLDVTTPPTAASPAGYLVQVMVSPTGSEERSAAPVRSAARDATVGTGKGGETRYRVELGEKPLPREGTVSVTYVIAANL